MSRRNAAAGIDVGIAKWPRVVTTARAAAATGALVWNAKYNTLYNEFIPVRSSAFVEAVTVFFTMFILLTSMIPISLIISLDIVKMMQAYFINQIGRASCRERVLVAV